jgi:hypothetical protein
MTNLRPRLAWMLALVGCGDNLSFPPDREEAKSPGIEPLACVPNLDGKIESDELAAAIGVSVRYVVSPPTSERKVDVVGESSKGRSAWDLASDYADDQALTISPAAVTDRWYAASFPADAFVTPQDPGGRLDSVGRVDDSGLYLLGIASKAEAPAEGETLLVYQPPILLLAFPVAVGQEHIAVGEIMNGRALGLPYAGRDTYEVKIDAVGSLELTSFTFDEVFRVTTKATIEPAVGAAVVRRQVGFFAECFGEVARATSLDDEKDPLFSMTSELRRLGY